MVGTSPYSQKQEIGLRFLRRPHALLTDMRPQLAMASDLKTLAGIIDPAKVTRTALENAASVTRMILATETLVTDAPEKETSVPAAPGGPRPVRVSRRRWVSRMTYGRIATARV